MKQRIRFSKKAETLLKMLRKDTWILNRRKSIRRESDSFCPVAALGKRITLGQHPCGAWTDGALGLGLTERTRSKIALAADSDGCYRSRLMYLFGMEK